MGQQWPGLICLFKYCTYSGAELEARMPGGKPTAAIQADKEAGVCAAVAVKVAMRKWVHVVLSSAFMSIPGPLRTLKSSDAQVLEGTRLFL